MENLKAFFAKHSAPLLIVITFATGIWLQFHTMPSPDLLWLSHMADAWLSGEVPYRDIFDPAPPLIIWIYTPLVYLAKLLGMHVVATIKFATITLIASSAALCAQLLRHSSFWNGKPLGTLLVAIVGLLMLSADNFETFGQREHLLIALILPYLLLRMPTMDVAQIARPLRLLLAVMAAVGFCIKPYFFAIWFALLCYRLATTRSLVRTLGIEEWIIGITPLLYLAAVWQFLPEYFSWLHIVLKTYPEYAPHGQTGWHIAASFLVVTAIALFIGWRCRVHALPSEAPWRKDVIYFIVLSLGAYLNMWLQFKTWHYIYYPWQVLSMIVLAMIYSLRTMRETSFWLFVLFAWFFKPLTPWDDARQMGAADFYEKVSDRVAVYGDFQELYPLNTFYMSAPFYRLEEPLRWLPRFNCLQYLLVGILETSERTGYLTLEVRPGREELERWLFDHILEDLEKKQPPVVLVQHIWNTEYGMEDSFNLIAWLMKDARLARFLDGYELRENTELCAPEHPSPPPGNRCNYRIYTRK